MTPDKSMGDVEAHFNLRNWLEKAVTAHGATVTSKGVGFGGCDLTFKLEGFDFYVECRPRMLEKTA